MSIHDEYRVVPLTDTMTCPMCGGVMRLQPDRRIYRCQCGWHIIMSTSIDDSNDPPGRL